MLVPMAISRIRAYSADRFGAEICGDPSALAGALRKLEHAATRVRNDVAEGNSATAHMFIVLPLHARAIDNLLSTHPKTANRIAALDPMARERGAPQRAFA